MVLKKTQKLYTESWLFFSDTNKKTDREKENKATTKSYHKELPQSSVVEIIFIRKGKDTNTHWF